VLEDLNVQDLIQKGETRKRRMPRQTQSGYRVRGAARHPQRNA
jgi:hypothetical protein